MAVIPDDNLRDLNPQTNREWFMYLNNKIDAILESQAEDREILIGHMEKTNKWVENHDCTLNINLQTLTRHNEKIDQLEKKVNAWSLTNTIGVVVAGIMAIFLKGE